MHRPLQALSPHEANVRPPQRSATSARSAATHSGLLTRCRLVRCLTVCGSASVCVCCHGTSVCQCLLAYVLHWLCVHATHADWQISSMLLEPAAAQPHGPADQLAPHGEHTAASSAGAAAAPLSALSSRRVPSVSQLLDWLSLLCDAQVGLLALGGGGAALSSASHLVRSLRLLIAAHFYPAASTAKHCHALAKAIQQQQQQQSGRRRGRTAKTDKSPHDVSQSAYSVEYIVL